MRRKVVKTKYADRANSQVRLVPAVWCDLECGHHVIRFYNARQTYTQANCEWCDLEKRDGVRYIWRRRLGDFSDGPDYVPDPSCPLPKYRVVWRELAQLTWSARDFETDQQAARLFAIEQRNAHKSAYLKRWSELEPGWFTIG